MRTQYKDIKQIKDELINDFMEENQEQINNMNDEDFNDLKQEFLSEWVNNKFIYDSDIINLLSTNIVDIREINETLKDFNAYASLQEIILIILFEKLEEAILI